MIMKNERKMMIDIRVNGGFKRLVVDDMEICARDGIFYFFSDGEKYEVPFEDMSQLYVC